jgi:DMSO/TMAO reductase YedYZ molybdopterin-dependent catalytic subunit
MEQRKQLPTFPVSREVLAREQSAEVLVEGLVARPRSLRAGDLEALPRVDLDEPFTCEEGWQVAGLRWRGVRLTDVLALVEPRADARYVRIGSGAFVYPLSLDEADAALLADTLNGAPLTLEHGAPWRLVLQGAACFASVKWVDRLVVTAEPGENAAERIARARLD